MWESFVNLFLNLLLYIYKIIGNFGWAIILFTVVIKLVIYPLMRSQIKSSAAMMEMQKSPEYIEMMEKYKDNKEKLAEEQMKLYKKMGVNPTASCLPMLIQLPVIFALYQAVIAAIVSTPLGMLDLTRRVNTSWIQISEIFPINPNFLWMNLGLPERLYIPGVEFGIPVLAVLVLITTILQTKLTQTTPAGSGGGQESGAMMSGMMNIYMPLLMGFMAYTLASGLSLYFLVSNVFTIVQYGAEGKLQWDNLKFGKKKPLPEAKKAISAGASQKTKSSAVTQKKSSESASTSEKSASSAKSERQDENEFAKIDYREFKNKKKPKKNQPK